MSPKRKHVPQRSCVVCRRVADKRQLRRIVRLPEGGGVTIDPTGKLAGRGAYICGDPACWSTAAKSSVLEKALRIELTSHDRKVIAEYSVQESAPQGQQDV